MEKRPVPDHPDGAVFVLGIYRRILQGVPREHPIKMPKSVIRKK